MSKKVKFIFPVTLFLFSAIQLFLIKSGLFQIGVFFYLIYAQVLFSIDKKYIIALFVFHLPLLPYIPSDFKLFSVLGPHEIIYGYSFFYLNNLSKTTKVKLNEFQKLSIKFVYLFFFIKVYIIVKDNILGLDASNAGNVLNIVKKFFRYFLYFSSLVLLIKFIYLKDIYKYVFDGMKYSVVVLVLSMVFTVPLILMGANIKDKEMYFIAVALRERYMGFYGSGGDQNSAGIFLTSFFGFLLALYEKTGKIKNYIIFMGFAVLGILLTGSRTSFMALAIIILLFLITNKSGKDKFLILIACVIFYFLFAKQLDLVIQRFLDPSAANAIDPNDTGRVGKWILYTNWIIEHPETLLIGNLTNIPFRLAPHNYFIYIIYHIGIIPFLIFIKLFIKLLKKIKFKMGHNSIKSVYYILPFILAMMTVNSHGSSIYLWLYLPIGAYFLSDKMLKY